MSQLAQNKNLAFDKAATNYDANFTNSSIGKAQRQRVLGYLKDWLPFKQNILEINCGTGCDANWLTKNGHSVIATDVSIKMLEIAKNSYPNIEFKQCPFNQIKQQFNKQSFDTIFSNFGGLNCIDKNQLAHFFNDAKTLLKPGGNLVAVIMGRNCIWEKLYFYYKNASKVDRRLNNEGVDTVIEGEIFKTYYYTPYQIKEITNENYHIKMVKPIGLFIPPSYLQPYFSKHKRQLKFLNFIENFFHPNWLANYADHYIIHLQKK